MSPLSSNEDEERKVQWDEGEEHSEGVLKEEAQKVKKYAHRYLYLTF